MLVSLNKYFSQNLLTRANKFATLTISLVCSLTSRNFSRLHRRRFISTILFTNARLGDSSVNHPVCTELFRKLEIVYFIGAEYISRDQ